MAALLNLDHAAYVTLLPKSITTAIGMSISEELGGYVPITVAVILVTGILGNMFAEAICKLFKIQEPIAKGIAHRLRFPRHWYRQSHGAGGYRGGHEQPFHCGLRNPNRPGGQPLCILFVKCPGIPDLRLPLLGSSALSFLSLSCCSLKQRAVKGEKPYV